MRAFKRTLAVSATLTAVVLFAPLARAVAGPVMTPDITLVKTISSNGTCPGTDPIDVPTGTAVTYCYSVTNNTDQTTPVTYTTHTLTDDVLGSLIPPGSPSPSNTLPPGGSLTFMSGTTTITQCTTNTAVWTAMSGTTTAVATDTAIACACGDGVVDAIAGEECDQGVRNGATTACCDTMCKKVGGGDTDGDGICDTNDTTPGKANGPNIVDPQGYFYNEATGAVVPGGFMGISCAGAHPAIITQNGLTGQYAFTVGFVASTEPAEICTLVPVAPFGCTLSATCLAQPGILGGGTVPPAPNPDAVGAGLVGGLVTPHTCVANPFFLQLQLDFNSADVINNNIPLTCVPVQAKAPTMSQWGLTAACLALVAVGLYTLRRRQSLMQ